MNDKNRIVSAVRVILAIVFASILVGRLSAGDDEAKAEKAIRALGGSVQRDDKAVGKPVIIVNLNDTLVSDAELKELAALKGLQTLYLGYTNVTDAELKELPSLKGLQTLYLGHTKVTDAGLKELAALKGLQTLDLSFTQVTDAGLKELAALKGLQTLDLFHTTLVTVEGVAELRKALPKCKIQRIRR